MEQKDPKIETVVYVTELIDNIGTRVEVRFGYYDVANAKTASSWDMDKGKTPKVLEGLMDVCLFSWIFSGCADLSDLGATRCDAYKPQMHDLRRIIKTMEYLDKVMHAKREETQDRSGAASIVSAMRAVGATRACYCKHGGRFADAEWLRMTGIHGELTKRFEDLAERTKRAA